MSKSLIGRGTALALCAGMVLISSASARATPTFDNSSPSVRLACMAFAPTGHRLIFLPDRPPVAATLA